jgi:hypothetical protein
METMYIHTSARQENPRSLCDDSKCVVTKKTVYSWDVVFKPHTPILRRLAQERRQPKMYAPLDFRSNLALSITDDDPITVRELVDSEEGKLSKKSMVEEMATLDKNEVWDLVELSAGRKPSVANGCLRRS